MFLDEFPEFSKTSLEILRQPMENKNIVISRNAGIVTFPANFLLLAAMNKETSILIQTDMPVAA